MSIQQDNHYKEISPAQTVASLKAILDEMQIELEEDWVPENSIDTYSLRLNIKGTGAGSNGKGVSKEYALASAYAEFFERYQNNIILSTINIVWEKIDGFRYFSDERKMTAFDIMSSDNAFINDLYVPKMGLSDASILEKALALKKLHRVDYHVSGEDDSYTVLPFFSIKKGKTEYLPYNIYFPYYGSNGMCAGNTTEEALVQGLSEIFERFVQKKLFVEKISLPDIPEEYIKEFPYIYEMYQKLIKQEDYTFKLKDCSLGGQFPVAALLVIHKNTGKYGIKLGCHPDFGIAMERAFTEATQGNDITVYAGRSHLDFRNKNVRAGYNVMNSFKTGCAQYPYEMLLDPPTYPFVPAKDVSRLTNKEILYSMIDQIISMGHDILIRDVSSLGFPSYHILVPGMSEMSSDFSGLTSRYLNTSIYVARLLNDPSLITKENCKYIIGCLLMEANSQMSNGVKFHYKLPIKFHLPGDETGLDGAYLVSMCYAYTNDYTIAADHMLHLVKLAESRQSEHIDYYRALYNYLDGMASINHHDSVIRYLEQFFDDSICKKIDNIFKDPDQIITKQYPFHRQSIEGYCHKSDCCDYDAYIDCLSKLRKKQIENPISQNDLKWIFQDMEDDVAQRHIV